MTAFSKGRVEAGVGYVKKNLLAGLDITDFRALNPAARRWLDTVANVRIHGETRKRPVDLFALEREQLRPTPELVYDIGAVHTVRASNRFRVTFDTNRYSVPAEYASQRLTLKSYPDRLCIYHQDRLVARCCFSVCLVESPGEFAGLFRRRIAWDDGAIWEAVGVGAGVFVMNRCCRSGEDVGARAASVGKGWASAQHLSMPCPHAP